MNYKNIIFEKISKSEAQLQKLSLIGINYDKRLKNSLIEEYKNPTEISDKDIIQYENESNILLPDEYKLFLLKTNGGSPSKNVYNLTSKKNFVIGHFFTLLSKVEMYTLRKNNNNDIRSFPNNYLAIADTVNGDYILLNTDNQSNDFGSIYLYFHEKNGATKKISSTFESLLDKLYE